MVTSRTVSVKDDDGEVAVTAAESQCRWWIMEARLR